MCTPQKNTLHINAMDQLAFFREAKARIDEKTQQDSVLFFNRIKDANGNESIDAISEPLQMPIPTSGRCLELNRANEISKIISTIDMGFFSNNLIVSQILKYDVVPSLGAASQVSEDVVMEDEDEIERVYENMQIEKIARMVDPRTSEVISQMIDRANLSKKDKMSKKDVYAALETASRLVPVCTRAWNKTMLTSPSGYERPCGMKTECLSYRWFKRILKEFLTPIDMARLDSASKRGVVSETERPCLLCIRDILLQNYVQSNVRGTPEDLLNFLPPFKNMVGIEGEYSHTDMFFTTNKYSLPLVMNLMHGYIPKYDPQRDLFTLTESEDVYLRPSIGQGFQTGVPPQTTF